MRILLTIGLLCTISVSKAYAQNVDAQVMQLQEQVRQLTGQLEELNFQMLQLQEQLRRTQQDNEFRLQQLEDMGAQNTPSDKAPNETESDTQTVEPDTSTRLEPEQNNLLQQTEKNENSGAPATTLGTLTLDENGNVNGATVDFSRNSIEQAIDTDPTTSITVTGNAEEIYEQGYRYIIQGDYALAAGVFESFVSIYPDDQLVPDAQFWLAESILQQGRFEEAVNIYIETHRQYPDALKAPETMLKIGQIMLQLGNREVGCITLNDAKRTYPNMKQSTKDVVNKQIATYNCS